MTSIEHDSPAYPIDINLRYDDDTYRVVIHPVFDGGTDIFQTIGQLEYVVVPLDHTPVASAWYRPSELPDWLARQLDAVIARTQAPAHVSAA